MPLSACDRRKPIRMPLDQIDGPTRRGPGRACRQLREQERAGLAIDQAEQTMPAPGVEDRVDFPVADLRAVVAGGRPFADVALTREPSAAVVTAVACSSLFPRAPQMDHEARRHDPSRFSSYARSYVARTALGLRFVP